MKFKITSSQLDQLTPKFYRAWKPARSLFKTFASKIIWDFFQLFFQYFQLLLCIFPKLWSNFPRYIDGYFDLGKKGTNKQSQKNESFRIRVKAFQLNSHSHYATTNFHVQKFSPSLKFFSSSFMIFTTKVIFYGENSWAEMCTAQLCFSDLFGC